METLKKQNKLVDSLPLGCRNHPEDVIRVKVAEDFKNVSRSGCKYPCDYRLVCGHACAKLCHEIDSDHALYKCLKLCSKLCANNTHPCRNLCFENCGDCNELVERNLSRCGHQATMLCYLKEEDFKCELPCKLECIAGHACQQLCYEKCKCQIKVTRTLTRCQHEATMPCYLKTDNVKCKRPCKLVCSAGHACQQLCYEKCKCQVPVTRTLTRCQHEATMPCNLTEHEYKCNEPCNKMCPFGHPCNKLCFECCWPCETLVIKTLPKCNHLAEMACNLSERLFKCEKRCNKSCSSNHPCVKLCSESCGTCEAPVKKLLPDCGHEAIIPCHMEVAMYLKENLCDVVVEITLPLCGHVVPRSCFASDLPYSMYNCFEPCKKSCLYGHPCERRCHEPCGDCAIMVNKTLPRCEHKAMMPCHQPVDDYICQVKCHRVRTSGPECPELCHEKCGDCHAPVEKVIPSCGHKAMMPCYRDPSKHRCQLPCERKCPEGHLCPKICGADCGICIRQIEKLLLQCNHVNIIECYQSETHVVCNSTCERTLLCGHKCQETCATAKCTITCKVRVEKELPCKHIARIYCHLDVSSVECYQEVERTLPCGHVALVECHQDLETFVCLTGVKKRLPCEHIVTMACSMDSTAYLCPTMVKVDVCDYGHTEEIKCCDMEKKSSASYETVTPAYNGINVQRRLPYTTYQNGCPNVCDFKLECGHGCPSTCSECVASKSHGKCNKIFGKAFSLCPHKSLCAALLRPCRNFSVHSCVHRRDSFYDCNKSYEICLRSCNWNCPHYSCTTVCSQPCNRPPCNHPCRKLLKCGHVCSGLCGEPCISECRKCDKRSFMERIFPNLSIPPDESRFLELQPCLHLVEVSVMDIWVKENVKQLPGILDSSCFLLCPKCSERVSFCPRYNQYIRRHELCLIAAKKLIETSGNLKRTMEKYVKLCNIKVKEKLNQLRVNEKIKLGTLCILHEIEVLESQRKNLHSMQKCKTSLLNIRQRISDVEDLLYFENKPRLAADVIMIFKLYMDAQVRRLKTFIRGPSLRVLDKCSKPLDELECIEVTEDNFQKIWTKVEELNRKLSTKLSPQDRKDKITDYVDHLNHFYDLQLDADFLSHWACCRFGHVYSANEEIDKDEIDSLCPECHPLHNALLYFLKPEFNETAVMTKFDTAAYYKLDDIAADRSYPKRTDSDRRESDPLTEIVPDGNVDTLRGENDPELTQIEARVAPETPPGTEEKIFLGESFFQDGHPGRKGREDFTSWTQARLNREDSSGGQLRQLPATTQESQTRSSLQPFRAALQSVESPGQAFGGRDRSQSERLSCDNWRAKDGRATASGFSESSYKRNGASVANAKQSRSQESWRVSNSDDRDPENWRDSTAGGRRESPLSWRDKVRSQTE